MSVYDPNPFYYHHANSPPCFQCPFNSFDRRPSRYDSPSYSSLRDPVDLSKTYTTKYPSYSSFKRSSHSYNTRWIEIPLYDIFKNPWCDYNECEFDQYYKHYLIALKIIICIIISLISCCLLCIICRAIKRCCIRVKNWIFAPISDTFLASVSTQPEPKPVNRVPPSPSVLPSSSPSLQNQIPLEPIYAKPKKGKRAKPHPNPSAQNQVPSDPPLLTPSSPRQFPRVSSQPNQFDPSILNQPRRPPSAPPPQIPVSLMPDRPSVRTHTYNYIDDSTRGRSTRSIRLFTSIASLMRRVSKVVFNKTFENY